MLLSAALNRFNRVVDMPVVDEDALRLSCERCGLTFSGVEATLTETHESVVYSCPADGERIVTVDRDGFGLHGGSIKIRVGPQEVDWTDFIDS